MLTSFLIHWAITALSLWVASRIFVGLKFDDNSALIISALLLGFVNAIFKPILVFLTFPLTFLTFGFFLLVINAFMMLLVAGMVRGFRIAGFWTAFFASIFITLLSAFLGGFVLSSGSGSDIIHLPSGGGPWI